MIIDSYQRLKDPYIKGATIILSTTIAHAIIIISYQKTKPNLNILQFILLQKMAEIKLKEPNS